MSAFFCVPTRTRAPLAAERLDEAQGAGRPISTGMTAPGKRNQVSKRKKWKGLGVFGCHFVVSLQVAASHPTPCHPLTTI